MTSSPNQKAVFKAFFDQHLPQLPKTYQWPKNYPSKSNPTKRLKVPTSGWVLDSDCMTDCITLKHHVNEEWLRVDKAQRFELAKWIVEEWGGVGRNGVGTIESYVKAILEGNFKTPLQGVASYSKILSAIDSKQYAIYDARVVASLNALQMLMNASNPLFFRHLSSRNPIIGGNKKGIGFNKTFPKKMLVQRGWVLVPDDESYATYLDLLHSLKDEFPGHEVYHLEMVLFSMGPDLCKQAMEAELEADADAVFRK